MQKVEKYRYKNSWSQNLKWCIIPLMLVATMIIPAKAHNVGGFHKHKIVTMDVVKNDGFSSGTWKCESVKACYIKVLEAEARGAHQYCKTVTIRRDGYVVWQRDYQNLYSRTSGYRSYKDFPYSGSR